MYVCLCICIYSYVMYACVCMYGMYECVRMFIGTYSVYIYVCIFVSMYVCMYLCICKLWYMILLRSKDETVNSMKQSFDFKENSLKSQMNQIQSTGKVKVTHPSIMYVCMYVCMYVYSFLHICIPIYEYFCQFIFMYVCILTYFYCNVCMYVSMYNFIQTVLPTN